jgi:hypothetical protein
MARSGQGAGEPPQAIVAEGSSSPAPRPGASGLDTKMTWGLVGLGLVGHMLRSPRFYQTVAVAAIAVGSLRQVGQQNRASMTARLSVRPARSRAPRRWHGRGRRVAWPGRVTRPDNHCLTAARGQRGIHCRHGHGQLGGYQMEGGGDA